MSRLSHINEDLKNLYKEYTVKGTSLSLRKHVEKLQQKYESKVQQHFAPRGYKQGK